MYITVYHILDGLGPFLKTVHIYCPYGTDCTDCGPRPVCGAAPVDRAPLQSVMDMSSMSGIPPLSRPSLESCVRHAPRMEDTLRQMAENLRRWLAKDSLQNFAPISGGSPPQLYTHLEELIYLEANPRLNNFVVIHMEGNP